MRKSIQELRDQAAATIESNVAGAVSAADVRSMFLDFLNAIQPAYGLLTIANTKNQTVNITPSLLTFLEAQDSDSSQTTSTFANGRIARSERGTSRLSFNCDIETSNGRFVTFTIYKDGVATPWSVTANGGGAGNPVACSLVGLDYADPAATYTVMVSAEVNATVVTFSKTVFALEVVPVNTFA